MSFLMTYAMINFPNPEGYYQILKQMLQKNVDYIEVQLPFSNPVADGGLIHDAHQQALKYDFNFFEEIRKIAKLKKELNSTSKLVLMSYITPIFYFGLEKVLNVLKENNFNGIIVPDLLVGSPEQVLVAKKCQKIDLQWVPLISPLTSFDRLSKIKQYLQKDQLVYATARKGKTGSQTDFDSTEIQDYFKFLKSNLKNYQILIGFGVKQKQQLEKLNQQGFLVVIASELIQRINQADFVNNKNVEKLEKVVNGFLDEFVG
jgi:tryptophan synthase alpha chain